MSDLRVRFAPSPTGHLHIGGARTALINWLFARRHGGTLVLRIEDTDRERSSEAMTRSIFDDMVWLGLEWDEGPHHQGAGIERHRADARRLWEAGSAYPCFCSPAELEARRREAGTAPDAYRYDRHCLRHVSPADAERRVREGEPFALRFRMPEGTTSWEDAVYGKIVFDNAEIEDFVIVRTDGTPTYNMAVVSDDAHMRITHVIRGDDHVSNTPKQILLCRGIGAQAPVFAHVPMILGPDGKRLSKRHGATAVGAYRAEGILPEAMVNYLALLGWSPGTDEEVFTRAELIDRFSIERINRKSAIFNPRKLSWMNGQHLARLSPDDLAEPIRASLAEAGLDASVRSSEWLHALIALLKVRARTVDDIVRQAPAYLEDEIRYDPEAVAKYWHDPEPSADRLERLGKRFESLEAWDAAVLERALRELADELDIRAGVLIHALRVALTGAKVSPSIFEVTEIMGRSLVLRRLDTAVRSLRGGVATSGGRGPGASGR